MPSAQAKESPPRQTEGKDSDPRAGEPFGVNLATFVSVFVHVAALAVMGGFSLLKPHRPSEIPVFELLNLEKPKLRPLRPKVAQPPEPPPPEPARAPDAPKLNPKAVAQPPKKKPEPKTVREEPDTTRPVKDVVERVENSQPSVVAHVPRDPRLSIWGSRVQKKAETLWNPPKGMDILGAVKTIVHFKVTRDGTIQDAGISSGAGNAELDAHALDVIQRMERVPPIPENFPEDVVEVSYEFVYSGQ